ncbi:17991_t:CDS:10, partial [Acaulospora morrowiae]
MRNTPSQHTNGNGDIHQTYFGTTESSDEDEDACQELESTETYKKFYEVEKILKHNYDDLKHCFEYYIKWKGWDPVFNSWVDERDLNARQLLDEYWSCNSRSGASRKNPLSRSGVGRSVSPSAQQKRSSSRSSSIQPLSKRRRRSPSPVRGRSKSGQKTTSRSQSRQRTNSRSREQLPSHSRSKREHLGVLLNKDFYEGSNSVIIPEEDDDISSQCIYENDDSEVEPCPCRKSEDWEIDVTDIWRIDLNANNKLVVFLEWESGHVIPHPLRVVEERLPIKLAKYYRSILKFKFAGEYRELENYNQAIRIKDRFYNEVTSEEEYFTNYDQFGVKLYAWFWNVTLLSVINLTLGIFPQTTAIGLILSAIYAFTTSLNYFRGQPLTCPRPYNPEFYLNNGTYITPDIEVPLCNTCEYHLKAAVSSW